MSTLTASTTYAAAPTIMLGMGMNDIGEEWLHIGLEHSEYELGYSIPGGEWFSNFIKKITPPEIGVVIEGDIAAPKAKVFSYSTDIMDLAKSHKRLEAEHSDELLFGIELEFNHTGHSLMELSPLLGMGIFKQDSSVDGEYVTLPYPYSKMVRKISDLKDSFDKLLSANKELDPNSCVGMHIHISRKGLTDLQLHRLRGLFWKGLGKEAQTSYLCGRLPNGYCQHLPYTGDRNVALNEENKDTVEIRAFLSPSSAEGILRNLRLVKSWLDGEEVTVDIKKVADWWSEHNCCKRFFNQTLVTLEMVEEGFAVARALPYFTGRVSNHGVWVHELRVIRDEIEYGWGRPEPLHPPEPPAQPGWEVFDEPGDFDGDN